MSKNSFSNADGDMEYLIEEEGNEFKEEPKLKTNVVDFFAEDEERSPLEDIRETVSDNISLHNWTNAKSPINAEVQIDLEQEWETDAWLERWRMNPERYVVTAIPPELAQRIDSVVKEKNMKRNEFILFALEEACKRVELEKLRKKGLEEGDPAKLIKDPKTGKYRCFPADYFTDEELYGFEVIEGKYYLVPWEKRGDGWVQVNKGYFEAADQDAPYIKMMNNRPVGSWEVYPFDFFEDGWKWGIYNHDVIVEVKGRRDDGEGPLWLDIYMDGELVDAVRTTREVHRIIVENG
ncbi:hypothetical protein [Seinonella peptonophila]|uniref:hypothetical protein n=1 Tax=Seinonella peptonophila TaxID=112248 RepID=UPI00111502B6|nr:hypothetical protein [Seinonella peptonophila]